jgi:hypothetical protein
MSPTEKRRHPRKDVFSPVLIALEDQGFLTEAWDLSRGGARLGRPARWAAELGAPLRLYFLLDQETVITLAARLVREGNDHLGVEFSAEEDERIQALLYEARFLDQRTG